MEQISQCKTLGASASFLDRLSRANALLGSSSVVTHRRELFPSTLRLLSRPNCGSCILGDVANGFCHREGIAHLLSWHGNDPFPPLEFIQFLYGHLQPRSAKLIGLECADVEQVASVIRTLRSLGCEDVGVTCGGLKYLGEKLGILVRSGLNRVTLSVHRFTDEERSVLSDLCSSLDILCPGSIKINRVLLAGSVSDLPDMLEWIESRNYVLRLFSLMWTPGASGAFVNEYLHWTSVAHLFSSRISSVEITEYVISNRRRYKFALKHGGVVEVNMPIVCLPGQLIVESACRSCALKERCEEGYFGCGIRVGPDSRIYPCLLRPELSFAFTA